jgi:beta-glucosidase
MYPKRRKNIVCIIFTLLMLSIGLVFSQVNRSADDQTYEYPFQDPDLPLEKRVVDLVSRLSLEEKVNQLMFSAPAVERLGIPQYNWWSECLHGVARNGRATVFPQAIGLGATWDPELIFKIGSAIGLEARAKYNICSAHDYREIYQGLTFWSPNVNLFRDPRWGRGHETYGEDPYLTSRIGVAFVKGLQGDHPKYVQAAGCAKHYVVHSGPEGLRHKFNAVCSMKDLWETYLPAFEALVTEAKVEGVMGAYNRTNGHPCCAHPYLMGDVLRKKWGFNGYFTSDCWAIQDFYSGHHVVETGAEAAALALKEGCNLNCGSTYPKILEAVEQGLCTEADVDRNLKELLPTRFRLGLFDPPEMVPFNKIGTDVIACKEHVALSREAAVKSIVLLKNTNKLLPLPKDLRKIYVTGPLATHIQGLLANYYGLHEDMQTVIEGVVRKVSPQTKVTYRQGALLTRPNVNPIDWYSGEAQDADATIACLGISQLIEGEEGESLESHFKGDREDIRLPQNQIDFLKTIRRSAKKLVVVMFGGSPIAFPEVFDLADAVLFVWYPGQEGGNAVADVVFGDAAPSGRLPLTFPKSVDDLPPFEDYSMQGRTYRYTNREPFLPFGFGLSYTTFKYKDLRLSNRKIKHGNPVTASVSLINTGAIKDEEVVQLYIKDLEASVTVPHYSLKGFKRVEVEPGEEKQVTFEITPDLLQLVNEKGDRILEKGVFKVFIGGSAPLQRSLDLGASQWLEKEFEVW